MLMRWMTSEDVDDNREGISKYASSNEPCCYRIYLCPVLRFYTASTSAMKALASSESYLLKVYRVSISTEPFIDMTRETEHTAMKTLTYSSHAFSLDVPSTLFHASLYIGNQREFCIGSEAIEARITI